MRLTIAAALVVLTSGLHAQERPLVPNAGFEQGADGPTGWVWHTGEDGQAEFQWRDDVAHTGQRSFRVRKIDGVGYSTLTSDFIGVTPGNTYLVRVWVRPMAPARRGVYLMVTQHAADSDEQQHPNAFGNTNLPLVADEWQEVTARVTVREGNTRLRVQCLQAFLPSDVCWDDLQVEQAGEEPPPRYEPPVPELLPELEPARQIVSRRQRARVEIAHVGGRPRLSVDGRSVPWAFYVSPFWNPQDAQIADFRDAGVRVYLVPLVLGRGVYADRGPWLGAGRYDFSEVDELLWRVLRVDPEGYVIFYMACDAYREWGEEHPDDVTQDQNGLRAVVQMHPQRWGTDPVAPERYGPSLVSQRLRDETAETLRRLVAHVETSEPGKAVIGYHVAGYNDGQWFQWARLYGDDIHLADYCPAAQESFREWLRRRYGGDVGALRAAWNRPDASFETAAVPTFDRYWAEADILDPRHYGDVVDHTRFYSEGVAETVMGLARVIKEASGRRVLCGTYYEDITCNSPNHIALGRLLADDSIDYFAGPAAYSIRMAGYQGAIRSVFGSTLLHGRTFLTEQDWRSWHSSPSTVANNFAWGRAETAEVHNAMVRRECGMMLAFGAGTWWYDMSGGWFRDDQIMAAISESMRAFALDAPLTQVPRADVALVVSEDGNHAIAPRSGGAFRHAAITGQIQDINLAGVPYRIYLQSDLGNPNLPDHRVWIFLNAYALSETERAAIERLKSDGRTLVFIHAPAAFGAPNMAEAISEVSGITVSPAEGVKSPQLVPLETGHPVLEGLTGGINMPGGVKSPLFAVSDPDATPLARYAQTDRVAAAIRDFADWRSVYVSGPGLTPEFVNSLARWAGCWCAAPPGDAVYASQSFITIHALFPGAKTLTLAEPSRVTDLISGERVSERAQSIDISMQRGETRWFFLEPR